MIDEDAGLQSCQLPLLSFFSFYLKKHLKIFTDAKSAEKQDKMLHIKTWKLQKGLE